jgi:3',5'-cyclic-AMP phosphodiesterase
MPDIPSPGTTLRSAASRFRDCWRGPALTDIARNMPRVGRRAVVRGFLAAAATSVVPLPLRAAGVPVARFGVISDVHQDVIPDAADRITTFVAAMTRAKADFVVELGDFCMPKDANRAFVAAWKAFAGPRHHVLGNHDMDGGFSREQTVAFLGMPARYYTFDGGSFQGVVLDGNDAGGRGSGYARYIAADQCAWLEKTLAEAIQPVILFVHQPLDDAQGVENGGAVRAILEKAERAKPGRVLATIAGHLHLDYLRMIGGLPYVQINSAAYYWLGDAGQSLDYFPADTHERYKSLRYVAAYRGPLWALVEVDLAAGEIRITGRRTEWVGPSAVERAKIPPDRLNREYIRPAIGDRRIAARGRVELSALQNCVSEL